MKLILIRFPKPQDGTLYDDAYDYCMEIRNYLEDTCKVIWIFEDRELMQIESIEL